MAYALDHVVNRITRYADAWKAHAVEQVFWGMPLKQFKEETAESLRIRAEIAKLEIALIAPRMQRDLADGVTRRDGWDAFA